MFALVIGILTDDNSIRYLQRATEEDMRRNLVIPPYLVNRQADWLPRQRRRRPSGVCGSGVSSPAVEVDPPTQPCAVVRPTSRSDGRSRRRMVAWSYAGLYDIAVETAVKGFVFKEMKDGNGSHFQ